MKIESVTADQIREIISNSLDRDTTLEDNKLKYLIELPLTEEEHDTFMNFINNK